MATVKPMSKKLLGNILQIGKEIAEPRSGIPWQKEATFKPGAGLESA